MEVVSDGKERPEEVVDRLKQRLDEQILGWELQERKNTVPMPMNGNGKKDLPTVAEVAAANKGFTCPECGEPMQRKEGKDYYQCSRHWGYPRMIERGEVRARGQITPSTA